MKSIQENCIRLSIIFLLLFFNIIFLNADNLLREKLTLKSGKVYYGELLVNNSNYVIIKLDDGSRFQFKSSDVLSIQTSSEISDVVVENAGLSNSDVSISAVFDVSGGFCFAKNKMGIVPFSQLDLIFGSSKLDFETAFIGVGLGYNIAFSSISDNAFGFLPLFIRFRKDIKSNIISPFMSADLGYAFSTNENYEGGVYSKVIFGVKHSFSYKTEIYVGMFAGVHGFSGELSESIDNTVYIYSGKSSIMNFGVNLGLQF